MSNIDKTKLYSQFRDVLTGIKEHEKEIPRDFGTLGYEVIPNQFTVLSPNPANFYVTMKDGTFRDIPHRGNVTPTSKMPVEIRYINDDPKTDRKGYIYGINEAEIGPSSNNPEAMNSVGIHSHHRGSGREFPIDLRLLHQLKGQIVSGMIVAVQPGFYFADGAMHWFNGQSYDFTANRPSSISYKRWAVVVINKDTNVLAVVNGAQVPNAISLLESSIPQISIGLDKFVYLFSVKLYQNRSALHEMDFVALYNIASMGGSAGEEGLIKVSSDDTTPGYLEDKLEAGPEIAITVVNNGGNEKIKISSFLGNPNPIVGNTVLESGRDLLYYARLKIDGRFTNNGRCSVIH